MHSLQGTSIFMPRKIRARLLPRSSGLAKNQRPDFTPLPLVLPDPWAVSEDQEDGPWSVPPERSPPVLPAHFHTAWSGRLYSSLCQGEAGPRRFHIGQRHGVVDSIEASFRDEDSTLMGSIVGAHSIRASAAAGASYRGVSLAEVVDARE